MMIKSAQPVILNRVLAVLFLLFSYALIFNPLTKFPYTFCIIILFILAVTWLQDKSLGNLNLRKLGFKEIKIILVAYLVIELGFDFVIQPFISWIFNEPADYSSFQAIEGKKSLYLKWLFRMWISAAIGEELLFRSFTFLQLRRAGVNKGWLLVLLSAVFFSLPHLYQGISGVIVSFLFGLAFGILYLKFRNTWVNIIVHGLIDTVFLTLSYLGMLRFYEGFW